MMRAATVLWAALAVVAGTGLFMLKYEVQAQEQRLANLHKDITETQESIHVLKAEWSYLNDPSRLREQAERHLGLHPLKPSQLASISSIPMADPHSAEPSQSPVAAEPVEPSIAPAAAPQEAPMGAPKAVKPPARPAAPRQFAPTKPVRRMDAEKAPPPAAAKLAATKPGQTAHPSVTGPYSNFTSVITPANVAPASTANVMVIKSPALAEPEMASTRARP